MVIAYQIRTIRFIGENHSRNISKRYSRVPNSSDLKAFNMSESENAAMNFATLAVNFAMLIANANCKFCNARCICKFCNARCKFCNTGCNCKFCNANYQFRFSLVLKMRLSVIILYAL